MVPPKLGSWWTLRAGLSKAFPVAPRQSTRSHCATCSQGFAANHRRRRRPPSIGDLRRPSFSPARAITAFSPIALAHQEPALDAHGAPATPGKFSTLPGHKPSNRVRPHKPRRQKDANVQDLHPDPENSPPTVKIRNLVIMAVNLRDHIVRCLGACVPGQRKFAMSLFQRRIANVRCPDHCASKLQR